MRAPSKSSELRRLLLEVLATSAALTSVFACADPSTPIHDAPRSARADVADAAVEGVAASVEDAGVPSDGGGAVDHTGTTTPAAPPRAELGDVSDTGYVPIACPNSVVWIDPFGDITPNVPVDYVVERWEGSGYTPTIGQQEIESRGTACATAVDAAACTKALGLANIPNVEALCATQIAERTDGLGCSLVYWAYTRGDEVGIAFTPAEKAAFIGHVDNVGEAIALATLAGYTVDCSLRDAPPEVRMTETGYELLGTQHVNCSPDPIYREKIAVSFDGVVTELGRESLNIESCAMAGRRPEGFESTGAREVDFGTWLAQMGALEAASVTAFRRIHDELRAHGAPAWLRDRARAAARDEVRHARTMRDLAKARGATPIAPEIAPLEPRSLVAFALENAREGCVRETFGALVALFQAKHAGDRDLRAAMAQIAEDEIEHAALSWEIARWVEAKLDAEERRVVREAYVVAQRELEAELRAGTAPSLVAAAGLPTRAESARLLATMTSRFEGAA